MIIKFRNFITEELTGKFKDETEIIYRDKDLVCMIPKSQMTSNIYGQKTNWCQVTKTGFDNWSGSTHEEVFLLIRFLFKNGKKIRFTYFDNDEFYWANETGYHVLQGSGNPFEINSKRDRIRDLEKDILDNISKFYNIDLDIRGYFTDSKTFERRLTILVRHKTATVPFTSRSYFSPLNNTTVAELISMIEYLTYSPGIDDVNKVLDLVEESAIKTLEILKGDVEKK